MRWRDSYIGIYRANQVLANIDNIKLTDQTRLHIEAEARFLRAFLQCFIQGYNNGSVIIHTSVPEMRSDFYKTPSSAQRCSR